MFWRKVCGGWIGGFYFLEWCGFLLGEWGWFSGGLWWEGRGEGGRWECGFVYFVPICVYGISSFGFDGVLNRRREVD